MSQRDSGNGCNGDGPKFLLRPGKDGQIRVHDTDGYRLRADIVCFKDAKKQEILLVSCHKNKDMWSLPGGGFEQGETFEETALREAREEAGVEGAILDYIGMYSHPTKAIKTKVFTMIVKKELDKWLDKETFSRRRCWFSRDEALAKLQKGKPYKAEWLKYAFGEVSSDRT